jgi:hypothetical protein
MRQFPISFFSAFSPLSLSDLAAWFDASDSNTVLTSLSPDTPATDGQTVRRWLSKHNPAVYWDQSVLASQPTYTNAATGITFGGPGVGMNGVSTMADIFRNKSYGYVWAVAQDTNPTGGDGIHQLLFVSRGNNASASRLSITTRYTTNIFSVGGRRLDADGFVSTSISPNSSNIFLLDARFQWADNSISFFVNDSSASTVAFSSGAGSTENTASLAVYLGFLNGFNPFPGPIKEVIIVNGKLTSGQILNVRRYLASKWGITL